MVHLLDFDLGLHQLASAAVPGTGVDPLGTGGHVPPKFGLGGRQWLRPPKVELCF